MARLDHAPGPMVLTMSIGLGAAAPQFTASIRSHSESLTSMA
ncbi:hypothetical protein FM104_15445 [Microbacterium esteraromaticum]|uniref:Uncharacterized protein n=1 Tax=Microbacterium esteraromaticum TaxID=57043 RepID=A0A1R4KRK8_9MICO|nr:hypothetical protein FM104_15445 [Microbacterium esteraromaticum]